MGNVHLPSGVHDGEANVFEDLGVERFVASLDTEETANATHAEGFSVFARAWSMMPMFPCHTTEC